MCIKQLNKMEILSLAREKSRFAYSHRRYSVFLQNEGQTCLFLIIKDLVPLSSGFLPWGPSETICFILVGLGCKWNTCKYAGIHDAFCAMSNKILCFSFRSLLSSVSLYEPVAG